MEKFKVDFSGEEESKTDIVPGKYKVKVDDIEMKEGDKGKYLAWNLKILDGASKGLHITHRTTLVPGALFSLKDTLIAMGINVPKSAVSIDPDKFIGRTFGIEVNMRPYEGKEYPNVKKVFPLESKPETVKMDTMKDDDLPFKSSKDDEVSIDLE